MALEKIPPLYDAFKEYSTIYTSRGADYSITDLLKSPRQVRLFKRHHRLIEREVEIIKQLGSFRGNAIHDMFKKLLWKVIQKSQTEDYMVESMVWDRLCGRRISGRLDVLWKDVLYDFKTTSVWKKIFGDTLEWEQQLNMYAYMLALVRIKVNHIRIILWYQDWDKIKALSDKGSYPKIEMEELALPLWPALQQQEYIVSRIELHKKSENVSDDDLSACTAAERWDKESSWAAYKDSPDGKLSGKAARVLKTKAAIKKWIGVKEGYTIVHRPGERTKCEHWCSVMPFCNQHKEYVGGM